MSACNTVTSFTVTPHCNTVTSFSDSSPYTSNVPPGPLLLMQHSCPTLAFKPPIPLPPILSLLPLLPHHRLLLPPPDFFRVLQWNAGGLRARTIELLYFLSSHPVDPICIQESNLNSSSSFQIIGFSTLRSDCTHSWFGILSPDARHASSSVIIFVRQGLSSSERYTASLFA